MPTASVDAVRFERKKAADTQLEAQVRLTLYLAPRRGQEGNLCMRLLTFRRVLLGGLRDASNPILQEARQDVLNGRGEEALAMLEKASRENPGDTSTAREYFRTRDLLVAQWLAQAEVLRPTGRLEAADDALPPGAASTTRTATRARAGLAQLETDRRHRIVLADAQKLLREEKVPRGAGPAAPGAGREPAAARGAPPAARDRREAHQAGDRRRRS